MNLYNYDVLVNDTFYRCMHILDYIEFNPHMDSLEKDAVCATIMDSLVYTNSINPLKEFLDFDKLLITNNVNDYHYEKYPNICGIPLFLKEEFRKHSLKITGGVPISVFLAKPPSKITRYCVYDPNTAVSALFDDATFYEMKYLSPTRGVMLDSSRPFVEILIDDEKYLVDVLTKRIIKSSFFRENFEPIILSSISTSKMLKEQKKIYQEQIAPNNRLADYLCLAYPFVENILAKDFDEIKYEVSKTKELYPDSWTEKEMIEQDMEKVMKLSKLDI